MQQAVEEGSAHVMYFGFQAPKLSQLLKIAAAVKR
jgi:hypothetical protein